MSAPRNHFIRSAVLARDERTACGRKTDNLYGVRRWANVTCKRCLERGGRRPLSVQAAKE